VLLGAFVGALVGVLVVAVRVTLCLFSWPYPGPPTKEMVTLLIPVMSDGAVHDTCLPPLVVVPLLSTTIFCVPVHPAFAEYPPPVTEPAVACTTPFWAVIESRVKTTVLEAEKVEALCDVRMLLSVTAPGDAPMKETVVVIMLAPELLCVSCRLQSMYDGRAAVKTSQVSPQRNAFIIVASALDLRMPRKGEQC